MTVSSLSLTKREGFWRENTAQHWPKTRPFGHVFAETFQNYPPLENVEERGPEPAIAQKAWRFFST